MTTIRILSLLLSVVLTGCASGLRDGWDELAISRQNRRQADRAWEAAEPVYGHLRYEDDFEDGFKAGYVAVAEGRADSAPVLPDRKYWTAAYRSPAGHGQAHAWLDGYAHGALAADYDGIAHWNRIPMAAPVAPENVLPQHIPHPGGGPIPAEPAGEPVPAPPATDPLPVPPATHPMPAPPAADPVPAEPTSIQVPIPPDPAPSVPAAPLIFPVPPVEFPEFTTQQVPTP